MIIDNCYELGDTVYLKTDTEQLQRIVTRIDVTPKCLLYRLSCGVVDSCHYDFELTSEKSYISDNGGGE